MSITEKRLKELRERLDAAMKDWSNQNPASNQVWNFFAHAPTDIADLIAEVHRLRAEIDRLRGQLADAWDERCAEGVASEDIIYWNAVGYSVTNPYRKEDND